MTVPRHERWMPEIADRAERPYVHLVPVDYHTAYIADGALVYVAQCGAYCFPSDRADPGMGPDQPERCPDCVRKVPCPICRRVAPVCRYLSVPPVTRNR